jgi:5-methyltetrahydrofolate--homocysteine methyltransferase
VIIGDEQPTVLIGERINPAGRKKLQEALKKGDLEIVQREALSQANAGADILDVSVGTFGVDEVALLPQAVQLVIQTVDLPLCIDSAYPKAIESALKVYKGKPLINSVTAEEHSLAKVLPLVKDYSTAVIGLLQDDEGIPKNSERRLAVARKLVERVEAAGIPRRDLIIDCLAFAVGADPGSGPAVIEAIRKIKEELGVNLTLGASNISFGLPDRPLLNKAFIAMAIASGVTCLIVDVSQVRSTVLATDLIMGRDKRARRYIESYRQHQRLQREEG